MFTLVAVTMRTSVFSTLLDPTLRNSPVSSTRSKRTWVETGSSATSSKKIWFRRLQLRNILFEPHERL